METEYAWVVVMPMYRAINSTSVAPFINSNFIVRENRREFTVTSEIRFPPKDIYQQAEFSSKKEAHLVASRAANPVATGLCWILSCSQHFELSLLQSAPPSQKPLFAHSSFPCS